jgi:hypothetical protein
MPLLQPCKAQLIFLSGGRGTLHHPVTSYIHSYSREFCRCQNIYKKSCDIAHYRSEESELTNQEVLIRDLLKLEGVSLSTFRTPTAREPGSG